MAETETTPLVEHTAHVEPVQEVLASARFPRTVKKLTVATHVVPVVALLTLLIGFFLVAVWPFRWVLGWPSSAISGTCSYTPHPRRLSLHHTH
jgi:hypothetical protein